MIWTLYSFLERLLPPSHFTEETEPSGGRATLHAQRVHVSCTASLWYNPSLVHCPGDTAWVTYLGCLSVSKQNHRDQDLCVLNAVGPVVGGVSLLMITVWPIPQSLEWCPTGCILRSGFSVHICLLAYWAVRRKIAKFVQVAIIVNNKSKLKHSLLAQIWADRKHEDMLAHCCRLARLIKANQRKNSSFHPLKLVYFVWWELAIL